MASLDAFRSPGQSRRGQVPTMRRTAMIGFLIGVALGCLFGATMRYPGAAESEQPFGLSVNQQTGKPQIHVKGKPEIK